MRRRWKPRRSSFYSWSAQRFVRRLRRLRRKLNSVTLRQSLRDRQPASGDQPALAQRGIGAQRTRRLAFKALVLGLRLCQPVLRRHTPPARTDERRDGRAMGMALLSRTTLVMRLAKQPPSEAIEGIDHVERKRTLAAAVAVRRKSTISCKTPATRRRARPNERTAWCHVRLPRRKCRSEASKR